MGAETLEYKVLGLGNFAANVAQFERWDSLAEIQTRRTKNESMQAQRFYASDAAAYSIRNGNYILELYDLNNQEHFPDKSEFVASLRRDEDYSSKLPTLEDKARTINLSDETFNKFVTKDNDKYSHITFNISDVVQGREHFEKVYGTEVAKLFTAVHGEEVYSEEGVKGRFRENLSTTNIYFLNQGITANKLAGKEEGTKLLRGACLGGLGGGSGVVLGGGFYDDSAHVSGVVKKSGAAGAKVTGVLPYDEAKQLLAHLVPEQLHSELTTCLDQIYKR